MRATLVVVTVGLVSVGAMVVGLVAARPTPADLPKCSLKALSATPVPNLTITSSTAVAARGANPDYCDVLGFMTTTGAGAPAGSAGFQIKLPANWNHKFLYWGVGGSAGNLTPSANPTDVAAALVKG